MNTVEGEGGSGGSDSGSDGSDSDSSSSGYCEGEQDDKGEDCTKKQFGGEFPPTCPPGQCSPHPHTLTLHPRIPKRTLNAISFVFLVRTLCYFGSGTGVIIRN